MTRFDIIKSVLSDLEREQKSLIIVEIGTDEGTLSEFILENTINSTLYCIDPYIRYDNYIDSINDKTGDELYNKTKERLKKFGDRVKFIRKFSDDATQDIPDNIDFLYIDGNHQYNYVLNDITNYYEKVKNGGIIIGDDAVDTKDIDNMRNNEGNIRIQWGKNCYGDYGVIKAFNDYLKNKTDRHTIIGNQYIIIKS